MKLTNEKEMDILLSRLARRRETGVPVEFRTGAGDSRSVDGDNGTSLMNSGEHLDADELNAYAENALLPAARARYAAHLADCETCRKIVTDLALAGGVATRLEKSAATPARDISKDKSWWQSLTALFTLPVVRYGVPALALLAIISVAYIATRQRTEDSTLVAQNKEPAPASAVQEKVEENHSQAPSGDATTTAPSAGTTQSDVPNSATAANNNTDQLSARTREKNESDSPRGGGDAKEVVPPVSTETGALSSTAPAAATPAPQSKAGEAPTRPETASKAGPPRNNPAKSADEVAATQAPSQQRDDAFGESRESTGGARAAAEQQRQRQQQQQARSMDRGRDMTIDGAEENTYILKDKQAKAASPSANASVARKRAGGPVKSEPKAERESAPANESAGETRNVGGRTFRRRSSAWVDTAYNSSRATVNVSRGSEQYRALLADEPTLRTIAEQLGGEVIVVWKNRAYRIH